jgi:GH24 family phage-related lysozyme (muramidase)
MPARKVKNKPSPVNEKVSQMTSQFTSIAANKLVPESQSNNAAVEVLGRIYDLLCHAHELKQVQAELDRTDLQIRNLEEEQRNQAIIKVLTGKIEKPKPEEKKVYKSNKTQPKKTETPKSEKPQKVEKKTKQNPTAQPAQPKSSYNSGTINAPTAQSAGTTPIIPSIVGAGVTVAVASSLGVMASSVIAKEESFPRGGKAYFDGGKNKNGEKLVSIGYGHQIKQHEYNQGYINIAGEKIPLVGERGVDTKITKEQAKKLLDIDLPIYEESAKQPLGDSWNKLSDQQKTALISYSYNVGSTKNLVRGGLKDAIDSGDMNLASKIIYEKGIKTSEGKYNKVLDERRARESKMFLDGARSGPVNTESATPTNLQSLKPTGTQINNSSQENKDMKKQLKQTDSSTQVNVNNSTTTSGGSGSSTKPKGDDRPAMLRKSQD